MSISGINALLYVTQQKAEDANQDAIYGAEQQRQMPGQQTQLDRVLSSSSVFDHFVAAAPYKAVPPDPVDAASTAERAPLHSTTYAVLGNMNGADIEALCFLVLMEASKSAQEDLKAIMSGVKSVNESKSRSRFEEEIGHRESHVKKIDP